MNQSHPKGGRGQLPEGLQFLMAVAATVLLFAACCCVPSFLGDHVGRWAGLSGAILAIVCWIYLVPTRPGFLQGSVALTGLAALLGLLVARVVHYLAA